VLIDRTLATRPRVEQYKGLLHQPSDDYMYRSTVGCMIAVKSESFVVSVRTMAPVRITTGSEKEQWFSHDRQESGCHAKHGGSPYWQR
jgi:hypothetical protein